MAEPESAFGLRLVTVAELTERIKGQMETAFPHVAVTGEVADCARPRSGHVYFTLRDADAQLRCVMWRGTAHAVGFPLEDGMQIVTVGRITVYAPRGAYQMVVDHLVPKGIGDMRKALEKLRAKLAAEGLFDEERKQELPALPMSIGVVTSATGAAVQDILRTALSRFPRLVIRIFPVRVQGTEAPREIVGALHRANRPGVCDVILLGRGGGSVEDLWAFNDEQVVRAVAGATVPVVSCVGHEIDTTLSDLAADVRASTPTRAAELAVPVMRDVLLGLQGLRDRAIRALHRRHERAKLQLEVVEARSAFRDPLRQLEELRQYLDEQYAVLQRGLCALGRRAYNQVDLGATRLRNLDPLATLDRGFAVARAREGKIVRSVQDLAPGDTVEIRFRDGLVRATVTTVCEEDLGKEDPEDSLQGRP